MKYKLLQALLLLLASNCVYAIDYNSLVGESVSRIPVLLGEPVDKITNSVKLQEVWIYPEVKLLTDRNTVLSIKAKSAEPAAGEAVLEPVSVDLDSLVVKKSKTEAIEAEMFAEIMDELSKSSDGKASKPAKKGSRDIRQLGKSFLKKK